MKTYTKTTEEPRLEIHHDDSPESPREWGNLGYFITCERNYNSPDKNEELESIIKETGETASDVEHHMTLIRGLYGTEKVLAIYPVYRYEHGNAVYKRGTANGFDVSNSGFYIITDKTQKEMGTEAKDFEKVVDQELETYTKWVNGEVYGYILHPEDGTNDEVESCWGFYSLDEIRDELPDEFKNEDLIKYLSTNQ